MTLQIGPADLRTNPSPPKRKYGWKLRSVNSLRTIGWKVAAGIIALVGFTTHNAPAALIGAVLMIASSIHSATVGLLRGFGAGAQRKFHPLVYGSISVGVVILGYSLAFQAVIPGCSTAASLHQSLVTLLNAPDGLVCPIHGLFATAASDLERLTGAILFGVFISLVVMTMDSESRRNTKKPAE